MHSKPKQLAQLITDMLAWCLKASLAVLAEVFFVWLALVLDVEWALCVAVWPMLITPLLWREREAISQRANQTISNL